MHGRDRLGLDCWGLVRLWYSEQLGIELASFDAGYTSLKDRDSIDGMYHKERDQWQEVTTPQQNDAVMIQIGRHWCHVGVMVQLPGRFLHILGPRTLSVIEELYSLRWETRGRRFYRLPLN